MKKFFLTAGMVTILLFFTGCALRQNAQLVNCGEDTKCADELVTQCSSGTFIIGTANAKAKFVVKEKQDNNCIMEWGFLTSGSPLSGFTMSCAVPQTIKNAEEISNYLFANKYQNCNGELKDKITKPIKEAFPEQYTESAICTETECANKLLMACEKGSFVTKTDDGSELKFSILTKVATSCISEAQFVSNSKQDLVGPKMRCLFPATIQTVADISNLIKNKFIISDSNICTGELYKLIK